VSPVRARASGLAGKEVLWSWEVPTQQCPASSSYPLYFRLQRENVERVMRGGLEDSKDNTQYSIICDDMKKIYPGTTATPQEGRAGHVPGRAPGRVLWHAEAQRRGEEYLHQHGTPCIYCTTILHASPSAGSSSWQPIEA